MSTPWVLSLGLKYTIDNASLLFAGLIKKYALHQLLRACVEQSASIFESLRQPIIGQSIPLPTLKCNIEVQYLESGELFK